MKLEKRQQETKLDEGELKKRERNLQESEKKG